MFTRPLQTKKISIYKIENISRKKSAEYRKHDEFQIAREKITDLLRNTNKIIQNEN